jgi:hypothetical protein
MRTFKISRCVCLPCTRLSIRQHTSILSFFYALVHSFWNLHNLANPSISVFTVKDTVRPERASCETASRPSEGRVSEVHKLRTLHRSDGVCSASGFGRMQWTEADEDADRGRSKVFVGMRA